MEFSKKAFRTKVVPILSPCLITFSVPLLIPGLTLTLVAFTDETGFSKFSGLHVLGMIMLAVSGLLFVAGCVARCTVGKDSPQVSPSDEEGLASSMGGSFHEGHVHSTHAPNKPHNDNDNTLDTDNDKEPRSLSGYFDHHTRNPANPNNPSFQIHRPSDAATFNAPLAKKTTRSSASSCGSSKDGSPSPSTSSLQVAVSPPSRRLLAPLPPLVLQDSAAASQGPASNARSQKKGGGVDDATQGTRKKASIETEEKNPRSSPRSCNLMNSDSDEEKRVAENYTRAAQTVPEAKKNFVSSTSTVTSSPATSSTASFPHEPGMYKSFDAEADPVSTSETDIRDGVYRPQVKIEELTACSLSNPDIPIETTLRQTPFAEDEFPLQNSKGRNMHEIISHQGETNKNESNRIFVIREIPPDNGHQGNSQMAGRKHCKKTGDRATLNHYATRDIEDTSVSSIDQQASPALSMSRDTYSVKSHASSEELRDIQESPLEPRTHDDAELQKGGSLVFSPATYHAKGSDRPLSPVPLSPGVHDQVRQNSRVTVSGKRDTISISVSSMESSPSRPNDFSSPLSRNVLNDQPLDETVEVVNNFPLERKAKKKKKKKKKNKDTQSIGVVHVEAESETFHTQQHCGTSESPLKSIMHSEHHSNHHVHWPDNDDKQ